MRAAGRIRRAIGGAVVVAVVATASGCASPAPQAEPQSSGTPVAIPAENAAVSLPKDMYLHPGTPTEWWWNIGTLRSGERVFGFEINASAFPMSGWAFTQIMLTDVQNDKHYQATTVYLPPTRWDPQRWAESDPAKNWYARLGDRSSEFGGIIVTDAGTGYTEPPTVTVEGGGGTGGKAVATLRPDGGVGDVVITDPGAGYTSAPTITISGGGGGGAKAVAYRSYVSMSAAGLDPTQDLHIEALASDEATLTPIKFDLTESLQGDPFIVWGNGVNSTDHGLDLQHKNYYFSLPRLKTSGTITIDGERFPVDGVTWMDHEYGNFGSSANPVKWNLSILQLDNGWNAHNYFLSKAGEDVPTDVPVPSYSTLQGPDGKMYYVASTMTPLAPKWTSPATGEIYYTRVRVEIPLFNADVIVTARIDGQEFPTLGAPIYEGIGSIEGAFRGERVGGDAWIEQAH